MLGFKLSETEDSGLLITSN